MGLRARWLLALVLLITPLTSWGCEPILPLAQLLSGSSAAGPYFLSQSIVWLIAAVALKSGAFVFFERRLSWREAVLFMVVANILSTVPGVLVAALTASTSAIVLAIPLVCLLGMMVGRRISVRLMPGQKPWVNGKTIGTAFVGFFFLSVVLFYVAESALDRKDFALHWAFKFLFVALVACTGIMISAALEECVIAWLSRKSHGHLFFYPSVIRANYVTLAFVLAVAAIQMLPKRLNSPHFIASWFDSLSIALGLT